ncbi:MAG: acetylxylan esterase [Bacteroidales bacterium]|jgi:cephalosporin-C deacetylase-like acetyl esterase|nr:acetylxylan esterase [Bacteroidales bacterium]
MLTRRLFFALLAACTLLFPVCLTAQPGEKYIKVAVAPKHADWVYRTGEKAEFEVSVTKNDVLLQDVDISYEVGPEMLPPVKRDRATLKNGKTVIDGGTMKTAGFLRCRVYAKYLGKNYEGLATAAFSPETIRPTAVLPEDFLQFWNRGKEELAKIPVNAQVTLLPERCTGTVNVYHVGLQNYKNSRVYGILCVPKKPGRYPALLRVPGAGVRAYYGDIANAERGAVTFEIGIHGIPVTMDASIYRDLSAGALSGYTTYHLDDKDRYYYNRVYLGCVRAVDFIFGLPEFDGVNIVVAGGSQGGALAIVTAGLDSRIKGLVSFYPALCDLTGYLNGRAGGWPHIFNDAGKGVNDTPKKIETSGYYDVVNFARQVKVPGFYSWGYNDVTCPPTSLYSAYNVITAPKTLLVAEETGHWTYPEQWEDAWNWTFRQFK